MEKSRLLLCELFEGIHEDDFERMMSCLGAKEKKFDKDNFIFYEGDPAEFVGIVLSGGVNIIHDSYWGDRTILTHVEPFGLFGEAFSCAELETLPVSAVASDKSVIVLIDYRKVVKTCSPACVFHGQLIANMLRILARKNILLTRKLESLSQRTTREKLLSFLSEQAIQAQSNCVTLPYNRQELADYLCVDRSALSRELAAMKNESLIDYEKNNFTLIAPSR